MTRLITADAARYCDEEDLTTAGCGFTYSRLRRLVVPGSAPTSPSGTGMFDNYAPFGFDDRKPNIDGRSDAKHQITALTAGHLTMSIVHDFASEDLTFSGFGGGGFNRGPTNWMISSARIAPGGGATPEGTVMTLMKVSCPGLMYVLTMPGL